MAGHEQDFDIQDSSPNAAVTDDGDTYTGPVEEPEDAPPEQRPGAVEENPAEVDSVAGYPQANPRSEEHPFTTS